MDSYCKNGGDPDSCICHISTINIPEEVQITKRLVDQLFNTQVKVNVKNRKLISKQLRKKDLSASDLWPAGIKKIYIPGDIRITPNLMKQLFKDSAMVDIERSK